MSTNNKSRFKNIKPLLVYVDPKQRLSIEQFAYDNNISMSQFAREAFVMRLTKHDDKYKVGYFAGMKEAARIANSVKGAQMMFPSGKTFGVLVEEEIKKHIKKGEIK
jgi:hypothetical protein